MESDNRPQMYATNEQLQRMAALSLDALMGLQFESTTDAQTVVTGCYVMIDHPDTMSFFEINPDGSYTNAS